MSLASILLGYNNPGALTVSSNFDYPGQTGSFTYSNGLTYGIFGSAGAGVSAIQQWDTNNIGSDDNNSITSLGDLASYYTTGGFNGNPSATGIYSTATGLSGSSPISATTQGLVAGQIANEGIVPGGLQGAINYITNAFNGFNPLASPAANVNTAIGNSGAPGTQSTWNAITAYIQKELPTFIVGAIGIILIIAGLFVFARPVIQPVIDKVTETVKDAAPAAIVAA